MWHAYEMKEKSTKRLPSYWTLPCFSFFGGGIPSDDSSGHKGVANPNVVQLSRRNSHPYLCIYWSTGKAIGIDVAQVAHLQKSDWNLGAFQRENDSRRARGFHSCG